MKTFKALVLVVAIAFALPTTAQTADEIIDNYLETIGGKENLMNIEAMKSTGKINFQGMQLPITMVQAENKMLMKANFQGMDFYQAVYDGETLWKTNQMTMAAEKNTAEETANFALDMNDFPDAFVNYKDKGYTVELLGSEEMEGTDTFKIKLTKEPVMVDGKEQESVSYYYFEKDNFVPIAIESSIMQGPMKGQVALSKLSDYQEVDGLFFPFSIEETIKGSPQGQQIVIESIEINPTIDASIFAYPEKQ